MQCYLFLFYCNKKKGIFLRIKSDFTLIYKDQGCFCGHMGCRNWDSHFCVQLQSITVCVCVCSCPSTLSPAAYNMKKHAPFRVLCVKHFHLFLPYFSFLNFGDHSCMTSPSYREAEMKFDKFRRRHSVMDTSMSLSAVPPSISVTRYHPYLVRR